MRRFNTLLFIFVNVIVYGQTEGLQHLATYPLQENYRDLSGFQDTLFHANVYFVDSGLYIDGADPTTDTANQVFLSLEKYDIGAFHISFDIKLDSLVGAAAEQSSRVVFQMAFEDKPWMILMTQIAGNIQIGRIGGVTVASKQYMVNQWHNLGISYNINTGVRNFYFDGQITNSDTFAIDPGSRLTKIGLGHLSFGRPFQGSMRNLQIYGAKVVSPFSLECNLEQRPISNASEDGVISIHLSGGVAPYQVTWTNRDTTFSDPGTYQLTGLGVGKHAILVRDGSGVQDSCEITLETPQGLDLLGHYPLVEHYGDITGHLDSLMHINVSFKDSSLYFDGADRSTDTLNQAFLSLVDLGNIDEYYISLDVRIDTLGGIDADQPIRTVFEIEAGEEWMTYFVNTSTRGYELGRLGGATVRSSSYKPNEWHSIAISYDQKSNIRRFYFDDMLINTDTFEVEVPSVLTSFGLGQREYGWWPIKGNFRNLLVYTSPIDSTTTSTNRVEVKHHIEVFPNPASSHVTIESDEAMIGQPVLWFDTFGQLVQREIFSSSRTQSFSIVNLNPGIYWILVGNAVIKFVKI